MAVRGNLEDSENRHETAGPEKLKQVGRSYPLHDAEAKATGRIRYTGDMSLQGMLCARILFSPLPHARIRRIDAAGALALPGVYGVFTHENTPDVLYNSQVWYAGQEALKDERLFPDTVRYIGDRVAAVVAANEQTAAKALGLIKVDYEELPAVFEAEQALRTDVPVPALAPWASPFFSKEISVGHVDECFEAPDAVVIEDRVETPKIHHAALEPHVCVAYPDHNGKITVLTPCQILYSVRLVVATVLGLPFNKVRVLKTPMGGSFGGKQEVTLEPLAAFFALATGRPVKIQLTRHESIISTRTRTKTIGYVRTAWDKAGNLLARDLKTVIDTGAYTSNGAIIGMAMGKKAFRLYRIPNQRYRTESVHTNTPVAGAARGYGSPQIHAITEINIDHAARRLGIDPVKLRLRNLVRPGDLDAGGGPPLGQAQIIACVAEGAKAFGWAQRRDAPHGTGRFRRGAGMACATHSNGYFGGFQDFTTMTLRMLEDGSMILNSGIQDLGCGTVTSMKQIIAEVMAISPDRIEAPEGDTETSPYDVGSQASRVTHVAGACALHTAGKLKEKLCREAAKLLECAPDEVILQSERIRSAAHPEKDCSYGEMVSLIQEKNRTEIIITETFQAQDNPGSYGADFVEVEVDTWTGLVRVVEVLAVHDVGRAINPGFVRGQIYGGVQMGIGYALTEDIAVDPVSGRAKGDRFSRYHLVNMPDMPPVRVILIEKGGDLGPFGAKSIGEIATCPTAPAVVNAVNQALGTNLETLPLTPERILRALACQ
ncbi:Aldehyde oxidase and xanthine dehydrogenase, a/b hammerhead domain protein [Acididesulfobacillus acetoxydans]|uniref:Aldehyde oxidase and xanthine dehydrogenase, a/b hammerhead domain protein n=1 Tax=Acididesulfobacillus acetoxydans TaxID=1561005 RepID=A0A8S0WWW8_9FIRM|nr:molybdopterin cofactor-binding domain-containing protein [Acididesulfobacillus acetoxydans]CAA7600561.1 Aldehyde oxidase and xanthine dehydrogenase, a/b hammerhead domain protein [Acididesulfobacillus acetoxydans]CEJ06695.1 Xanthine dehydrogenase molybdenum-binding subunit [Acididesulfobacillus acetoxydans]